MCGERPKVNEICVWEKLKKNWWKSQMKWDCGGIEKSNGFLVKKSIVV